MESKCVFALPLRCGDHTLLTFLLISNLAKHEVIIVLDTCAAVNLPNGTVTYDEDPLSNGRYPAYTYGDVLCNNGFQLFGVEEIECFNGYWDENVELCRCVPNDQGNLNNKHVKIIIWTCDESSFDDDNSA